MDSDSRSKGERTRSSLIGAAQERFTAVGFDRALGSEIAAAAGVSEPSISFHFGSKRGLFVAVMESYYATTQAEIRQVIDRELDPVPRLAAFTRWWVGHLAVHRDLIAEFEHQARPGRNGPEVSEAYVRLHGDFVAFWNRMIRRLQDADVLRSDIDSDVILQMFFGATRQLGADPTVDDERLRQLLEVTLEGTAARTASLPPRRRPPTLGDLADKLDLVLERLELRVPDADRAGGRS